MGRLNLYLFRRMFLRPAPGVICGWLVMASGVGLAQLSENPWQSLFNGENLDGWDLFIDGQELNNDPENFVQVRDRIIHLYRDTDPEAEVPFGYLRTTATYSSYHFKVDYRWLAKKFAPRKDKLRDAGILYHLRGKDKIWPACLECQIQEGDTGDLVFLGASAITGFHPAPDQAPQGLGMAAQLLEHGGYLKRGGPNGYLGRLPEVDKLDDWNTVEIIVRDDKSAQHIVNGEILARLSHFQTPTVAPLSSGTIGLQLEGAELQYRNIEIRQLNAPIATSHEILSLSSVPGYSATSAKLSITNPHNYSLNSELSLTGADADHFTITKTPKSLPAGATHSLEVSFKCPPEPDKFRFSAGLQIGTPADGAFVVLQGIGQPKFEGSNEPTLEEIVRALGVPINVGGAELSLDTKQPTIGDSQDIKFFTNAEQGLVKITPVARYSPKGLQPFGLQTGENRITLGTLSESTEQRPDAHQCLFPPITSGQGLVEFDAPEQPFSLFLDGPHHLCSTDPAQAKDASIPFTARCYPITHFQGKPVNNAYLVGFEEASNGDYQDALFLVENVKPAK